MPMATKRTFFVHETAVIDEGCDIGAGTKIWHFSHVMSDCKIGKNCNIGQNVVISPHVILGNNVKVIYRHAGYEKDNVALKAFSKGGTSLWDNEYMPSADMTGTFISMPAREQIPENIKEQLIVELYSK